MIEDKDLRFVWRGEDICGVFESLKKTLGYRTGAICRIGDTRGC